MSTDSKRRSQADNNSSNKQRSGKATNSPLLYDGVATLDRSGSLIVEEGSSTTSERRWCRMMPPFLFVINSPKDDFEHPRCVIDLEGALVSPTTKRFGFAIWHPRRPAYQLQAASEAERRDWMASLRAAIDAHDDKPVLLEYKGQKIVDEEDAAAIAKAKEEVAQFVKAELASARAELAQLQTDTQKLLSHATKLKAQKKVLAAEVHTLRAARTTAQEAKFAADQLWHQHAELQRQHATQRAAFVERVRSYDALMIQCSPEGLARQGVPPLLVMRRDSNADEYDDAAALAPHVTAAATASTATATDISSPSSLPPLQRSETMKLPDRRESRSSSSDGPQWDLRTVTPSKMSQEQLIELSSHCLSLLQREIRTLEYGSGSSTVTMDVRGALVEMLQSNLELRQKSNQFNEHIMNLTKAKLERFEQKFDKTTSSKR